MNKTARQEIVPLDTPLYRAYQSFYYQKINVLPHYHDELEVLVYNENMGSALIGGKSLKINSKFVHVVPPKTVHSFEITPLSKPCGIYVVQIRLEQIKKALSGYPGFEFEKLERSFSELPFVLKERRDDILKLIISLSFFSAKKKKKVTIESQFYDLEIISRLIRIIVETGKRETGAKIKDDRLTRILDALENRFSEPFILENISRDVGLSKHHLCRLFKKGTGMTLTEYTLKAKIQKACDFLEKGRKNVSQSAESCGFQSLSYFIKTFKSVTGKTPKQWVLKKREL